MDTMDLQEMQMIDGGSWFSSFITGVACGATVAGAIYAVFSPEPISKFAAYGLVTGAITCVGAIIAD